MCNFFKGLFAGSGNFFKGLLKGTAGFCAKRGKFSIRKAASRRGKAAFFYGTKRRFFL